MVPSTIGRSPTSAAQAPAQSRAAQVTGSAAWTAGPRAAATLACGVQVAATRVRPSSSVDHAGEDPQAVAGLAAGAAREAGRERVGAEARVRRLGGPGHLDRHRRDRRGFRPGRGLRHDLAVVRRDDRVAVPQDVHRDVERWWQPQPHRGRGPGAVGQVAGQSGQRARAVAAVARPGGSPEPAVDHQGRDGLGHPSTLGRVGRARPVVSRPGGRSWRRTRPRRCGARGRPWPPR